jgi:uncharacterized membrane protein YgaE (UPF0421/DUF939 family)
LNMLVYFMDIWSILRSFGIFNGHWVYFVVILYIFTVLVFCTMKNLATLRWRLLHMLPESLSLPQIGVKKDRKTFFEN